MKKLKVSIAIPAYNEEAGISGVLNSILSQDHDNFNLVDINVYLDGCTDNTENIVRKFSTQHSNIKPIVSTHRRGKIFRLNQIYKENSADILIIFDADIVLGSKTCISGMVKALNVDSSALVVAAHQVPIRPNTFIGKCIYGGYKVWDDTRLSIPNYDHIQNLYGAATAYRKSFAKNLQFPVGITDDRGYIYLMAKKNNGFRYLKTAWIEYLPVSTLKDFFKLADRSFNKNEDALAKIFGDKVYKNYAIPNKYKINAILNNLIQDPFYTTFGMILNIIARVIHLKDKYYDQGMWETATSTKKAILKNTYV